MKKMLILFSSFVVFIFLVKIIVAGGILQKFNGGEDPVAAWLSVPHALAEAPAKTATKVQTKDMLDDSLKSERELVVALQKKKVELDSRESGLRLEEQRLLSLKKEITDKIDQLKALETELNGKLEQEKTGLGKKFKDLAKVYESAPPDKAGLMLERMDVKTAAAITMNMKRDKAGIVWGYISSQKAVEITKEITRAGKFAPDEKAPTP